MARGVTVYKLHRLCDIMGRHVSFRVSIRLFQKHKRTLAIFWPSLASHWKKTMRRRVSFVVEAGEASAVFTGDTLFVGGCGRFFEGNPTQVYTPTYLLP